MAYELKEKDGFKYIDEGSGEAIVLLHGLFGALSNWEGVVSHFSKTNRVLIPLLPIFEISMFNATVDGIVEHVVKFIKFTKLPQAHFVGNSLGGHVALIYTLKHPEKVKSLTLTASSGLFENQMGGSFPKRGSYEYVRERVEYTFYDPQVATKELVDEVFEATTNVAKVMRVIALARSAQRHNMAKEIHAISQPTCLIWGLNDAITPPEVAHDFNRLLPNSKLHFIDKCGHAPMMEHPTVFNKYYDEFLESIS